jgi:chemotaxis protein methyltransferase CheR
MISVDLSDCDFRRFSRLVHENCGINLHDGKKELLRARLGKRLRETGLRDFKAYWRFLTEDETGEELVRMLDAISTNLTSFFREEKHFHFLRENVFPSYVNGNKRDFKKLRFWSAGCSSGEEPYSLSILLLEHFGERSALDIKILATDISTKALARAQTGVYPGHRLSKIPRVSLRKYFQRGCGRQEGNFRVKRLVRDMIEFRRFNLMEPFPFKGVFHGVLCRNVMIYFRKKTQQLLIDKFYESVVEGGYLFVGHSETLAGINHAFKYIMPSVYQKQ